MTIFSSDHRSFYLGETPFIPCIGKEDFCNVLPIPVFAGLDEELLWDNSKRLALVAKEKYLFWELDFGLGEGSLVLYDTARYHSYTLAIEQFLEKLWKPFSDKTFGVSLYKGKCDFFDRFSWSHQHEEQSGEAGADEELYCANVFAEYLHRLASYLPDELLPFCLFDTHLLSPARAAQILSKERFSHLHLGVKCEKTISQYLSWKGGIYTFHKQDSSLGILLPPDELCTKSFLEKLDELLDQLTNQGNTFRIIPEALFNELWDGLDQVIAFKDTISPQGGRKLLGFAAAGGEIHYQ
jgi:hypothetical protein